MEAIEKRPTEAQVNQIVTDKLAALIGAADGQSIFMGGEYNEMDW